MTMFWHHPDYDPQKPEWEKARDLYEGKHDIVCNNLDYLWAHQLELQGDANAKLLRQVRCQRTRYLNLTRCIVSLWKSIFFKHQPDIDQKIQDLFDEDGALLDIDGQGTSLTSFAKDNVLGALLIYGKPIVFCDTFQGLANSKADEKALGLRPFLEVLNPIDVVDWEVKIGGPNMGRFNALRHEYTLLRPRESLNSKPVLALHTDILDIYSGKYQITRYEAMYDQDGNLIKDATTGAAQFVQLGDPIETALDYIPVSYILGESWLKDVNEESLRFHNLRSSRDNIEHNQGYKKIILAGDNLGNTEALAAITENAIGLAPAGTQILESAPTDTAALRMSTAEALESVFKIGLNQLRMLPSDSRAVQGADTLAEEKDNTIAIVLSTIEDVENLMNEAICNYAEMKGVKNFQGQMTFSREITEEDIDKFIAMYQAFADKLSKVEGLDAAVAKKAIKKLNLPEEDELIQAVDETDFTPKPMMPMPGNPFQAKDQGDANMMDDENGQMQTEGRQGRQGQVAEADNANGE